jgi:type IV pilus assembly protein PilA
MITVAIISVLAVVAVPNFSRFQMKARISEAKAQLAALYTAQKAFEAEHNTYHSDLWAMGYRPNGSLRYLVGIGVAHTAGFPGVSPSGLTASRHSTNVICTATAPMNECVNRAVSPLGATITAFTSVGHSNLSQFSAIAEGFVGGLSNDRWSIDQNKRLQHVHSGEDPSGGGAM